jgi:transposase
MSMLEVALDPAIVIVAVDPGKVMNRVWVSNGAGLLAEPVSLPVSREGIVRLERLLVDQASGEPVIAVEATGSLHRCWAAELERLHPGSVRIFAPSETKAARIQLGSGRFKTDDRDCAALTYLARQGAGRRHAEESTVDALRAAVRHRRGLVLDRKVAQQRLHDQLNALCPGLSAPAGHGRSLPVASPTGLAVLACAAAFAGRPPRVRSLIIRAPGRMTQATAQYWVRRWRGCLPPPSDAEQRARRLARDVHRYKTLQSDIAELDDQITALLATTDGQVLTSLPGVAVIRAAAFAAHSLPITRFPDAEHLYCDRAGPGPLRIGDPSPPRSDLSARPGRTPRRTDEHGLRTVDQLTVFRPTQRRTLRPRHGSDPGPGGVGTQRLPPRIPTPTNPTTLR